MILIVTNRQDYTADFLILELRRRNVEYVRFNTEDFPQRVQITWKIDAARVEGRFYFPKRRVDFEEVRSIWYRRPVSPVPSQQITDSVAYEFALAESQATLDGVLSTIDCFWVSPPDRIRRAENKLLQLKTAASIGFRISPTIVTNTPDAARDFCEAHTPIAYKPLRRSRVIRNEGVSLIYTNLVKSESLGELTQVAYAPTLFQQYISKSVEVRVTVIGSKVYAVEIDSQNTEVSLHDWRRGDVSQLRHSPHALPTEIETHCVMLVRTLGLAFGAIDLVLTPNGQYVFLEINPNGQWAWIQQMCPDLPLRETLADLLINGEGSIHG